jgi:hypothetical protein
MIYRQKKGATIAACGQNVGGPEPAWDILSQSPIRSGLALIGDLPYRSLNLKYYGDTPKNSRKAT